MVMQLHFHFTSITHYRGHKELGTRETFYAYFLPVPEVFHLQFFPTFKR